MPFNTLILLCPPPTDTNFKGVGSKSRVSMERRENEKVSFFDISGQEKAGSFLRKNWGMKDAEPICDGIIYYTSTENPTKRIICLVELKGTDIKHAIEQVTHTRDVLERQLRLTLKSNLYNIVWKGYVHVPSSAMSNTKLLKKEIKDAKDKFGEKNFDILTEFDIRLFLRK
jgi:hypothetical protein